MKTLRPFSALLALSLSVFVGASSGQAQGTSALTFTVPASASTTPSRFNLGFEFSVSAPLQVTALSFYDYQGDGLNVSHPVGLYAGILNLATVTVTPGSPLQDSFRYVSLATPLVLTPGVTYTMGAFTHTDAQAPGDPVFSVVAGVSYAANFTFGRALSSGVNQDGLAMPTVDQSLVSPGYFGPGLLLAPVVNVPEPATWAILLGGTGALLAGRLRRRRSNRA